MTLNLFVFFQCHKNCSPGLGGSYPCRPSIHRLGYSLKVGGLLFPDGRGVQVTGIKIAGWGPCAAAAGTAAGDHSFPRDFFFTPEMKSSV